MQLNRRMSSRWRAAAIWLVMSAAAAAHGQARTELPAGMSFVARNDAGSWDLFRIDAKQMLVRVPTQREPRQACITPDGSKAVYAADDGTVRRLDVPMGTEDVFARADRQRAYTQPCMSVDGQRIYVVEMAEGKSLETEILEYAGAREPRHVARQPGAQHDPFVHQGRWLVYASVGCADGCEDLLVEIWARDFLTGKARQLTLLNAVSQAPVTDGRLVVFTSNASGTYQLWQVGLDGAGTKRLTGDGSTQAIHPALCGGEIYFVQSSSSGAVIARLNGDGTASPLPIPSLKSVRALRCLS